jgi:hypothetical protein
MSREAETIFRSNKGHDSWLLLSIHDSFMLFEENTFRCLSCPLLDSDDEKAEPY